jgi:hypothetical protein
MHRCICRKKCRPKPSPAKPKIPRNRSDSYLSILEDLLLCFQLPVFQRHAQRQRVQHQKSFFFDLGVFRSLRPRGPLDAPHEIEGLALETPVA